MTWSGTQPITRSYISGISSAEAVIEKLDVNQARKEVEPFLKDPEMLNVWSRDFFRDVIRRIVFV